MTIEELKTEIDKNAQAIEELKELLSVTETEVDEALTLTSEEGVSV